MAAAFVTGQKAAAAKAVTSTSDPVTVSFPGSTTTGNFIFVSVYGDNASTFTVTDNKGNTYRTSTNARITATGGALQGFWKENITGGASHTVSVTSSTAFEHVRVCISEFSGIDTSADPFDRYGSASGYDTAGLTSSATATTSQADELILGVVSSASGVTTYTAGTSFSLLSEIDDGSTLADEYRVVSSTGAYTSSFSSSAGDTHEILCLTFKAGAGVPTTATPTCSPSAGSYTSSQSVTLSCSTSGSTIYYTTDGSTPTTSSTVYSGAISVSALGPTTIKAFATSSGNADSAVATFAFGISPITYVGKGTASNTSAYSLTVTPTVPSAAVTGDLLIVVLNSYLNASIACTANDGSPAFAEVATQLGGTNYRVAVFWRVVQAAESGAVATPTFSVSGTANKFTAQCFVFRGCDATTPIDVAGSLTAQAAAATWTGATVSIATAGAMLMFAGGSVDDNSWGTWGGGLTTGQYVANSASTNDNSIFLGYDESCGLRGTGTSSAPTAVETALGNDAGARLTFALRPLIASTTVTATSTASAVVAATQSSTATVSASVQGTVEASAAVSALIANATTTKTVSATASAAIAATQTATSSASAKIAATGTQSATSSAAIASTATTAATASALVAATGSNTGTASALVAATQAQTATASALISSGTGTVTQSATVSASIQGNVARTASAAALVAATSTQVATASAPVAATQVVTSSSSAVVAATQSSSATASALISTGTGTVEHSATVSASIQGTVLTTASAAAVIAARTTQTGTASATIAATNARTATASAGIVDRREITAAVSAVVGSTASPNATVAAVIAATGTSVTQASAVVANTSDATATVAALVAEPPAITVAPYRIVLEPALYAVELVPQALVAALEPELYVITLQESTT